MPTLILILKLILIIVLILILTLNTTTHANTKINTKSHPSINPPTTSAVGTSPHPTHTMLSATATSMGAVPAHELGVKGRKAPGPASATVLRPHIWVQLRPSVCRGPSTLSTGGRGGEGGTQGGEGGEGGTQPEMRGQRSHQRGPHCRTECQWLAKQGCSGN